MPEERWERLWALFHDALDRPPDERARFLETECGDPTLRAEVDELIRSHESGDSPVDDAPHHAAPRDDQLLGTRLGDYRVLAVVAEGGMGVVYEAEQEKPVRRRVALKVVRPGVEGRDVLARFESESQALALMAHPNIAHAYGTGTTGDGRPYFAMEYVAGLPITVYADRHRLTVSERVELIAEVCGGLQHAHQKGVLHRDVKPSNILVAVEDGRAVPKIIDFGIAKALHQPLLGTPLRTVRGLLVGTPEHMSPEQLAPSGLDVDTRSDIYSLGVLLYELLVGALPLDWGTARPSGVEGLRRMVLEVDPPQPSRRFRTLPRERAQRIAHNRRSSVAALARKLGGDLDWIAMKALERDRTRRYASASELAADLRRHLQNHAVLAGPPGALYRASRFWRRHRAAAAAGVVGAVVAVGFAVATALQIAATRRALENAERERQRAEAVTELLIGVFGEADPTQGQAGERSAREILDRGAEQLLRQLADEPELRGAVMTAVGRVYANLHSWEPADRILREGLETRRRALGPWHPDVADSSIQLGLVLREQSDFEAAEARFRGAVTIRRRAFGPDHPKVGDALLLVATVQRLQGDFAAAEATLEEALPLTRADPDGSGTAAVLEELAAVSWRKGDFDAAEERFREALRLVRERHGRQTPRSVDTLARLGALLQERGEFDEAEPMLREVLALRRERFGDRHGNLVFPLNNLGLLLQSKGEYEEAERHYREALEVTRAVYGETDRRVVAHLNNLALLLHDRGSFQEAESSFREAMAVQRRAAGAHPDLAYPMTNLARVLHDQRRLDEAEPLYRRALDLRRGALPEGHPATADTLVWLGKLLVDRGDAESAEPLLREALAARRAAFTPDDWRIAEAESQLGGGLVALGRYAEAEPLLVRGYETMKRKRGVAYHRTLQALERIVTLYEAWGRDDQANRWRAERVVSG